MIASEAVPRAAPAAAVGPPWLFYAGLLVFCALVFQLGMLGVGAARPLFVLGSVLGGFIAWRTGIERQVATTLALFAVAPFLRRVVDLGAGYDPSGLMLTGPLLAILVPVVDLRFLLMRPGTPGAWRLSRFCGPYLLHGACVLFALLLTLFQGEFFNAASGALKWLAPLLYGLWLLHKAADGDALIHAAVRAFTVMTPIMGAYGVLQYVDPPAWDRYWMTYSQMTSIGNPLPFEVRVFSTMNSPASFATYMACGLLLIGFVRSGWQSALLAVPGSLGLMLSLYRTAWLALAAGILFCLVFASTRSRSVLVIVILGVSVTLAAVASPFADTISERLATFSQAPGNDGSAQERAGEYITLFNKGSAELLGEGFFTVDAGTPGTMPVDGQIVADWLAMGLIVGLVSLAALGWAGAQALVQVFHAPDTARVAAGAVTLGALIQIPLASMAVSEIGVMFWMFAAIATSSSHRSLPGPSWSRIARTS